MIENILITLISVVGGLFGMYIKTRSDNRKNTTKISNLVKSQLQGMQNQVVKVGMSIEDVKGIVGDLKTDTDFRNILKNSVRSEAARIVDISIGLETEYKNILMYWSKQIEDLALKFYYSPYRNNAAEMRKYLDVDIESRMSMVKYYTDHILHEPKLFNSEKIFFSDFLSKCEAYNALTVLIIRLVANGIKRDEVATIFSEFVEKFFKDIIKATIIWKTLNDI